VPAEASGDLVRDLFRSGRTHAAISGPWLAPDLPASLRYHVLPLPIVRAAGDRAMVPYSTIDAAMIPAGAAHPDQARELALFLASRIGSIARATAGHHIVASTSAWLDPNVARDERLVAFHTAALAATPMPTHALMDAVFGPVDRAIRKVLRGDASPHDALAEAEHRFLDETRAAPPARDPTFAIVALMLGLFAALAMATSRLRDPTVRAALVRSMPAYAWVTHAFVAVGLLVVLPLAIGALTSLFAGGDLHYVGLANYADILTNRGGDLLGHGSFWLVLAVTVLWTITNVTFHVGIGVGLALLLHRPTVKLRTLHRILLVVPWAVPSYVTALAWRGMFHRQLGAINAILAVFGVEPVSWFAHFSTAFAANLATNVWLGFPFMMVVTLGALTSIPKDLYEAADVDGASALQKLTRITLPMLRPALLPAVAMGAVWTFNMFNVVFLVSAGEPDGSTEILVSEAYRWAFTRGHQVGYAAAYAVLIFVILVGLTRALPRERAGAR
jgi:arabinogalactan oligomer/maltooligosaccharide transport system permease protein